MSSSSFLLANPPALAAAIAAVLTAAFGSLKFYSDKAAKVTDFRKAWIETLRQTLSEFTGSTHTIAGRIAIRRAHAGIEELPSARKRRWLQRLTSSPEKSARIKFDNDIEKELLAHWSTLRLSYNKILLHLNPIEHKAYSIAEEAIASYTKDTKPDPKIRETVSSFLHWCIQFAECETQKLMMAPVGKKRIKRLVSGEAAQQPCACVMHSGTPLDQARTCITQGFSNAGSCLLLAAFATRQLLHGSYETVADNVSRIERGIRVVDTAAAIVIKDVWEDIKKGEPSYRHASSVSMIVLGVFLLAIAKDLLLPSKSEPSTPKRAGLYCDVQRRARLPPAAPNQPEGLFEGLQLRCTADIPH